MPSIRESNGDIELEEEEIDNCDQDEDDDSGSESADDQMEDDDEGGSSEIDSEECDRRKAECADDMMELSEQFCKIKDQLFSERKALIDLRVKAISKDHDPEYVSRLGRLDINRKHRKEVADVRLKMKRESVQERFRSEEMAVAQNMKNDVDILYDQVKQDLEDKIKRLEEDRHSVDFAPDFFEVPNDRAKHRSHPYPNSERRKKAAQVSGPYIIYNLADDDILGDWTIIKRATKQQNQRRKVEL